MLSSSIIAPIAEAGQLLAESGLDLGSARVGNFNPSHAARRPKGQIVVGSLLSPPFRVTFPDRG
jgi:hypothetical protein